MRERIQTVREEALSPQALAAYEGEQTELASLEGRLIDGAEFTVKALEFVRIDFGHKATEPAGCFEIQYFGAAYLP